MAIFYSCCLQDSNKIKGLLSEIGGGGEVGGEEREKRVKTRTLLFH